MIQLLGNRLRVIIVLARCSTRKIDRRAGLLLGARKKGKEKEEKRKKGKRNEDGTARIFSPAYILKYEQGDEMINRSTILARKGKEGEGGEKRRIDETFEKDTFK